ncbi:hypothetical protein [Methylotenera sp.]|uniref:hypothetical protein n=1 Tax=Methylotenera sp. TaxID=2051956 RepID=UPI002725F78F|nr:hypothetical protein [Methylotenera sp.]MDO9206161.1 hypothetical protein [Methylotenera sp.]
MTYFINQTQYDALIEQRNNIDLSIENLLIKELELKGHTVNDEEIEEERMNLYFCISEKEAKQEFLTKQFVLVSIYGMVEEED